METLHYRALLKEVLSERCSANPNYSLRAFARDLGIEPAQLSRVLKGKQNVSLSAAQSIAPKIYKQKKRQEFFLNLVSLSLAKKPQQQAAALLRLKAKNASAKMLELAWIDVIADWYHTALLDLVTLPNAPTEGKDLARYLGISVHEVSVALDRLQNLGLLRRGKGGWEKVNPELVSPTNIPSSAIRHYHKQMIDKAKESIDAQSIDERFLYGRTMTVRKSDLPKVQELTDEYLAGLSELSESTNSDSLYQINVQIFNLKANTKG